MRGAGGTDGGLGAFFAGLAMIVAGGYLLMQRVTVHSGFWMWGGRSAFGLSLLPLLVGIGVLFVNGRSRPGWLLTTAGALIIVAGIIANLQIFFAPTSLWDTLMILGLMAAGVGLVVRSLRTSQAPTGERTGP